MVKQGAELARILNITPLFTRPFVPSEEWNKRPEAQIDMKSEERIKFDSIREGDKWRQDSVLRREMGKE